MKPDNRPLKNIVEGALLAAGRPLSIDELLALFTDEDRPPRAEVRKALDTLDGEFKNRGIELKEVASGFRIQIKQDLSPWIARLWEERPARYSRALLETLALIAYRQPITRGEIEDVRGVSVSTHIMRTLQDRGWIRIVGHRDVPGHPEMFGTTREFLDYFSLKSLDELPSLAQLRDIESISAELDLFPFDDEPKPVPRLAEDESSAMDETAES
jgi:segregation and condensation protein B